MDYERARILPPARPVEAPLGLWNAGLDLAADCCVRKFTLIPHRNARSETRASRPTRHSHHLFKKQPPGRGYCATSRAEYTFYPGPLRVSTPIPKGRFGTCSGCRGAASIGGCDSRHKTRRERRRHASRSLSLRGACRRVGNRGPSEFRDPTDRLARATFPADRVRNLEAAVAG